MVQAKKSYKSPQTHTYTAQVMTCVWAILGVQLIHPVKQRDLGRQVIAIDAVELLVRLGMPSLLFSQTVIAGDSWGVLAVPIIEHSWWTSTWFLNVLNCLRDGQPGILAPGPVDTKGQQQRFD